MSFIKDFVLQTALLVLVGRNHASSCSTGCAIADHGISANYTPVDIPILNQL